MEEEYEQKLQAFADICNALEAEVCLFQTPASFTPSKSHLENMREFFSQVTGDFIFAFEPRGQEWTPDIIQEICNTENLCHVVDPWKQEPMDTLETTYFRLHGLGDQKYKYKFTNQQLKTLKRYCSDYGNTKTYVLFNNYEMFDNCQRFLHYIRTGELPPSPMRCQGSDRRDRCRVPYYQIKHFIKMWAMVGLGNPRQEY